MHSFCFCSNLAAIAAEKKNQRDTIRKQRDDYSRRASALKRELITLKEQREELATGNEPPSPTTHAFIKENDRLQVNTIRISSSVVLQHTSCTLFISFFRPKSSFIFDAKMICGFVSMHHLLLLSLFSISLSFFSIMIFTLIVFHKLQQNQCVSN